MPRNKKTAGYGAAGGRRNTQARSAKQVTRRQRRNQDDRVVMSLEEAREHQAQIEARIAAGSAEGPATGAQYAELTRLALQPATSAEAWDRGAPSPMEMPDPEPFPEQDLILSDDGRVIFRPKPPPPEFVYDAKMKRKLSALGGSDNASVCGTARYMLRKGYRIDNVMHKTGARFEYLSDLPIGRDGRIPEDKRDDW